jgi:hypothetical protein
VGASMVGRSWTGGWGWLPGGDGGTERESGRTLGNQRRQVGPTVQRYREREREGGSERAQACADRRGPPVRHRGRAGASRARAGLSGPVWAEIGFPFSRDF